MSPVFFLFFLSSVFVPTDDGIKQVPIVYVDANLSYNGGYHNGVIYLNPNTMWLVDQHYGLNVWTHEVLHAWGYSHADMRSLFVTP